MPKNMICDVSSTTLRSEALLTVTCDNNVAGGMNVSEDTRIRIEFTYQKIKGGFNQIVVGEIYAKYIDS
jgi:hypothetical protein